MTAAAHAQIVELVRRGYDAWNRGELAAVLELIHPDFRCDEPPGVVDPGPNGRRRGLERALRRFFEVWAEFHCRPEEFRRAGDLLVAVVVEEGRRPGSESWTRRRCFHVWTVRGDKVVRFGRLALGDSGTPAM